jgi:hypothetical protein
MRRWSFLYFVRELRPSFERGSIERWSGRLTKIY